MKWFNIKKLAGFLGVIFILAGIALAAGFERLPQPLIKMGRGAAESIQILFENDANETLTVDNTGDATFTPNNLKIGDGTDSDMTWLFDRSSFDPGFRWNETDQKLEFSKDGVKFTQLGTGSGSGTGINLLQPDNNPGFEDGTDTWVASTPAQLTLETVNPIFGDQSGIWDPAASLDTLETADIPVPIELKGRSCSAAFTYLWDAGTTGQITALVQTDGGDDLTLAVDVEKTLSVTREVFLAFICPTTGDVKITLTATANAQPITLDSFHLGSNIKAGTVDVFRGWKSYDENDVSITYTPTSTLQNVWFIPFQDEQKNWYLEFSIHFTISPNQTDHDFTIDGVTFDGRQALTWASSTAGAHCETIDASGTVNVQIAGTFGRTVCAGRAKLTGKPTWADDNQLPQETVTLETQGWHIAARITGADINEPSADTTSFTELTHPTLDLENGGSAAANIACANGTAPSGLTCSGGDEALGINFTAPYTGSFQICTNLNIEGTQDGANEYFEGVYLIAKAASLTDTTTAQSGFNRVVVADSDNVTSSGDIHAQNIRICDVFDLTAGETPVFLIKRIMDKVTFTGVTYGLNGLSSGFNGGKSNYWSVIPLTQQFPQAIALPKSIVETKILSGDQLADGVMTDLTYSGLDVGSCYQVLGNFRIAIVSGDAIVSVGITNGATAIGSVSSKRDDAQDLVETKGFSAYFEATDASLTFSAASITPSSAILGNNSKNETYVQLIKQPHTTCD